jgi:hypothetical protein
MRSEGPAANQPAAAVTPAPTEEKKTPPAASRSKPKAKPTEIAAEQKHPDAAPANPLTPTTAPAPAEPVAPPPSRPFPTMQEIRSGADADKIVETYGEPALSTLTADNNHVLETLVYTKEQGKVQTLIRVEDGKVLSAHSEGLSGVVAKPPAIRPR